MMGTETTIRNFRHVEDTPNPNTASLRQTCEPWFYSAFIEDLERLLQTGSRNVYKWLHQPYATPETPSGDDLWANIVELGHTQGYMLPNIEANLVRNNQGILKDSFSSLRPFGLIAGAGTRWAVLNKEIPVLKAINACGAADWDICSKMGQEATKCIKENLGVPAIPIIKDFTEPLEGLEKLSGSAPIFITMFGCTLGNDIDLKHVPDNFAKATQYKGFFLVTIDSSREKQALEGYQSPAYKRFQNNYWTFVKYLVEDEEFDDTAIQCCPYYTEVYDPHGPTGGYRSVIHRHIVERNTSIKIRNKRYYLKKGMELNIGRSHKWEPEDIKKPFAESGWNQLAVINEGTVSAILYAGRDTPQEWLQSKS